MKTFGVRVQNRRGTLCMESHSRLDHKRDRRLDAKIWARKTEVARHSNLFENRVQIKFPERRIEGGGVWGCEGGSVRVEASGV
jgi:hypothetical protein